nr:EOG090X0D00 [Lepidurus arcticus]
MDPGCKPSNEEYKMAKWMRSSVPKKKTKFLNHSVEYFTASKAIDALLKSRWAKPSKGEPLFTTREEIVEYLDLMLRHKFFHRARKIPVSEKELLLRAKKKDKKKDAGKSDKEETKKQQKEEEAESSVAEKDTEKEVSEDKTAKKRKVRLDMHLEQVFVDGLDAYVWIYDPVPYTYWLVGSLLVIGAVALCLFPLWPPTLRKGVYYLSVAAAGFLLFILALAVIRLVVFAILWIVTGGKHHLWLFPNLTEDVSFLASFWPVVKYEYRGEVKKNKKDKDSDNEDSDGEKSDSDSEPSQTGKDFELLEKEEISQRDWDQGFGIVNVKGNRCCTLV